MPEPTPSSPTRAAAEGRVVVVGLGYVGLPVVAAAVGAGMSVAGLDASPERVAVLQEGRSPVDDLSDDDVAGLLAAGFTPTGDPDVLAGAAVVVICVPTPLGDDGSPDLTAVEQAAETVAARLGPGTLVVLESTTYPGTTEELLQPVLERGGLVAGTDFHLAYSPERIDPGNRRYGLANTPKVLGGLTPACADAAEAFYGAFCEQVVRVASTRVAELTKLLENTYRTVNIALVNEMAVFCHDLGVDLWEAIDAAATKPFGFAPFRPGPGVGGHCIPIDPDYLSYAVRRLGYPFRFVELAQEVNARMPAYVVARAGAMLNDVSRSVRGARVLLVGVTYKADVADERQSPSVPVARRLLELGALVSYADPFVPSWRVDGHDVARVDDPVAAAPEQDLVVLLQPHSAFDVDAVAAGSSLFLDTRGVAAGDSVERL
ncbi:nucleotide sugar dehydrogenase [Pseudokineococcus sp. 1T1Z-3]|uniref:nucleotide sugar dehydrogenase n=1 Tax=Pseudokineococcus sp. 1T1Z-3 TaxID=3132745 RepID=UPI0030B02F3F